MAQREFEITIAPDGGVELHVKGYKGKSCLEVMKLFEQVVGEMKARRETANFTNRMNGSNSISNRSINAGARNNMMNGLLD